MKIGQNWSKLIFNYEMVLCVSQRVPQAGESRQKWIKAIESHQQFDQTDMRYAICQLHFQPEHFKRNTKTIELIKGALPTIFPTNVMYVLCGMHDKYIVEFSWIKLNSIFRITKNFQTFTTQLVHTLHSNICFSRFSHAFLEAIPTVLLYTANVNTLLTCIDHLHWLQK